MTHVPGEVHVLFLCWGNICRSPMAERVAVRYAEEHGVEGVRFTSAGVSDEEHDNPIDQRARRVLQQAGYSFEGHHAHRITPAEALDADLVVAMEQLHADRVRAMAEEAEVRLLTDFVPGAQPGDGVPDPWYGGAEGFHETLASVEAAMPGLFAHLETLRRR